MKVIVGLGNIGKEYEHTRHNAGFDVIDLVADQLNVSFHEERRMDGLMASVNVKGEKILLVKPTTFMNLSGRCVGKVMDYYNVDIEDLLVIHDDLDLPVGKLRLRQSGSNGGQKGMGDIIQVLGTQKINRLKLGIGRDTNIPVVDYVLGKFHDDDLKAFQQALVKSKDAVIDYINGDAFEIVMNHYNNK